MLEQKWLNKHNSDKVGVLSDQREGAKPKQETATHIDWQQDGGYKREREREGR